MYEFIDVNQTSGGMSLPSEALQINGEYIENLITGYRTLTVEGREALSPELDTYETGIRDGATLKNKKYPPRIIRITYQIIADSNTAFRNAYNELARILDVKDAQLIFADEQDKFFTGTPSYIGEVTPGRNSVVGEFEILCTDPFKYSVEEREVTPVLDSKSILLDYGGTYKAFPKLVAEFYKENEASEDGETVTTLTGAGDCGYVAFFNENEKIIQLGDPEEIDTETVAVPSQTLVNSVFETDKSWGSAAKSQWSVNSGLATSNDVQQVGSLHMAPRYWRTVPYKTNADIILDVWSKAEAPYIHYLVGMQGTRTSSTTAKLNISIKANLENSSSYFRMPYELWGEIKIALSDGTKTSSVCLKKPTEIWEGTAAHLKTFTIDANVGTGEYITGILFRAYRKDILGNTGVLVETRCSDFWIGPDDGNKEPLYYHLTAANYGPGAKWHGPSITRRLPADSSGEVGAKNFKLSFSPKMSMEYGRYGALQCLVVSGSGSSRKILAGISLYHNSNGNKYLRLYVNGAVKETIQLTKNAYPAPAELIPSSCFVHSREARTALSSADATPVTATTLRVTTTPEEECRCSSLCSTTSVSREREPVLSGCLRQRAQSSPQL